MTEVFILGLVGGLLALDGTSVGQFMVSRPIVAATLGGWLTGDPSAGLLVGGILELFYLPVIPSGGGRYPEAGLAGMIAAPTAVWIGGLHGVAIGVALGLLWGIVGGETTGWVRRLNERLLPEPGSARLRPGQIERGHSLAILLDLGRATILTWAGVGSAYLVVSKVDLALAPPGLLRGVIVVFLALAGGALLQVFGGWQARRILFMIGVGAGILSGLLL